MAKIEQKQPIIKEIAETIDGAQAVILVRNHGLTVAQDTALRKDLREAGVIYKVHKNTMMNFAFEGTQCEELKQYLKGPNVLAVSKDDATAPAKILAKYEKEIEKFEIIGGVVEGKFVDVDGVKALAAVPSRDELISKFLGSIQSPITNFARVIRQIAEKEDAPAE